MKRGEIDVHTRQTLTTQQVTLLFSHNAALSPSWFPLLSHKTNLRPKHTGEPKSPDGGAGSCGQSHLAVPPALVPPAWPHPAAGKACSCSVPQHFPSRGPTTAAPSLPVQLVRRTRCATHFLLPPRQDVARMHAPRGSQAPCSTVGAVLTPRASPLCSSREPTLHLSVWRGGKSCRLFRKRGSSLALLLQDHL